MSIKRPGEQLSLETALAPSVSPFGDADLALVRRGISAFAPEWAVELQGICASQSTLLVVPESGDDAVGPSFVMSRDTYGIRVDQVHWDTLTEVGVYSCFADALQILRLRLAFRGAGSAKGAVTLH
jgi:hypothetical protein